jgi:transposase
MKLIRVGVDLAKNVFQVHGVDRSEKAVWRRKLVRADWIKGTARQIEPGCEIGMEACSGAHHWARLLQAKGYTVKLIAPQFVKPYVKSNKNDANDAEAICEAMSRPSMRFVAVKTVEQQDIQAVHRVRSSLMDQRKAKANQIRGLTSEYGLVAPKELLHLSNPALAGGPGKRAKRTLSPAVTRALARSAGTRSACRRARPGDRTDCPAGSGGYALAAVRGIGPLTATALLATVGDASQFSNGDRWLLRLG